ncbi:UNVERIFIED_CONTAM: hypothetical protein NCL1_33209 [Trichonephila clavipes]
MGGLLLVKHNTCNLNHRIKQTGLHYCSTFLDVDCQGNQTFTQYADCDKRCDFIKPPEDCAGAIYVACACKDGYLAVDESRKRCVKPEDCP